MITVQIPLHRARPPLSLCPFVRGGEAWGNHANQELGAPQGLTRHGRHKPEILQKEAGKPALGDSHSPLLHLVSLPAQTAHCLHLSVLEAREGQMAASRPRGWGRACAQEDKRRGRTEMRFSWRTAREEVGGGLWEGR